MNEYFFFYVTLDLLLYVSSLCFKFFFADKLSILLYYLGLISLERRFALLQASDFFHEVIIYLLVPSLYLWVIFKVFFVIKRLLVRYLVMVIFVIFSVDYVVQLGGYARWFFSSKDESVAIKGGINYGLEDDRSDGFLAPFALTDSVTHVKTIQMDVYLYNHTTKPFYIPAEALLYLRPQTKKEHKMIYSKFTSQEVNWDEFKKDSCIVFKEALFENKSDRYMVIKPGETKWIAFQYVIQSINDSVRMYKFLADNDGKIAKINVFKPTANILSYPQYWQGIPVIQPVVLDNLHGQ